MGQYVQMSSLVSGTHLEPLCQARTREKVPKEIQTWWEYEKTPKTDGVVFCVKSYLINRDQGMISTMMSCIDLSVQHT